MRRRTPGRPPVPPFRRGPGVVVVALLALAGSVVPGGLAYGAAPTDGAADARLRRASGPIRAIRIPALVATGSTVAGTVAAVAGDLRAGRGPFPVDPSTVTLTDESRGRTLVVALRIPRTDHPVPVVVIVHGYAAAAADYAVLADNLAAAGYAVASPDFPRSSAAVTTSPVRDITEPAADVSFVLDALLDGTTVPAVAAHLDPRRVAVLGHSDGGVTVAGAAFNDDAADPRIGAAVVLSGGAFGFTGSWYSDPTPPALLVVHGTADTVNPLSASAALFDGARGAKWLVAVTDGDHAGPFTDGAAVGDVAALVVTFLDATLGGDAAASAALPTAAEAGDLTLLAAA